MRALFLFALILTSCYAAPKPEDFEKTMTVNEPFEVTWEVIVEIMANGEWPIESIERESGLITTSFVQMGAFEDYADCGKDMLGVDTTMRLRCKINVYVKPVAEGHVDIRINTHFEGASSSGSYGNCNSTGKLEAELFQSIQESL